MSSTYTKFNGEDEACGWCSYNVQELPIPKKPMEDIEMLDDDLSFTTNCNSKQTKEGKLQNQILRACPKSSFVLVLLFVSKTRFLENSKNQVTIKYIEKTEFPDLS